MTTENEKKEDGLATTGGGPTDMVTVFDNIEGVLQRPQAIGEGRAGTEDIRQDEIKLPRLAIAQGLSPQVITGDPKHIPGLALGQMFNDVSETIYGMGPLTVIPVLRHVSRIEFDPNDKKRPIDRDVPVGDKRLQWDGDNPPKATEFVEYVCLLLQKGKAPELVVVSIKTTNKEMREAAKLWNTYVQTRGSDIYTGMYRLTSHVIRGTNRKGEQTTYGVFVVKNAGFIPADTVPGAALLQMAKEWHERLKDKTVITEREGGPDDEATGGAASDVAGSVVDQPLPGGTNM
jgi:hypothetical protein